MIELLVQIVVMSVGIALGTLFVVIIVFFGVLILWRKLKREEESEAPRIKGDSSWR